LLAHDATTSHSMCCCPLLSRQELTANTLPRSHSRAGLERERPALDPGCAEHRRQAPARRQHPVPLLRCVCVCVCMYVCMYVCICMCVRECVCVCVLSRVHPRVAQSKCSLIGNLFQHPALSLSVLDVTRRHVEGVLLLAHGGHGPLQHQLHPLWLPQDLVCVCVSVCLCVCVCLCVSVCAGWLYPRVLRVWVLTAPSHTDAAGTRSPPRRPTASSPSPARALLAALCSPTLLVCVLGAQDFVVRTRLCASALLVPPLVLSVQPCFSSLPSSPSSLSLSLSLSLSFSLFLSLSLFLSFFLSFFPLPHIGSFRRATKSAHSFCATRCR
jgi:hypothetical protein